MRSPSVDRMEPRAPAVILRAPNPASGQTISNDTVDLFDITGTGTVKGLFLVGGGTAPENKGDHATESTLWATVLFDEGDVDCRLHTQARVHQL